MPLPKWLRDAPELHLGLEFAYGAFADLSTCRSYGWGPGQIPWAAIYDYASVHDLTAEQAEELAYLVRKMDEAYLRYHEKKTKERSK